ANVTARPAHETCDQWTLDGIVGSRSARAWKDFLYLVALLHSFKIKFYLWGWALLLESSDHVPSNEPSGRLDRREPGGAQRHRPGPMDQRGLAVRGDRPLHLCSGAGGAGPRRSYRGGRHHLGL